GAPARRCRRSPVRTGSNSPGDSTAATRAVRSPWDGTVLPWEAEPTRPGSGAGLYESEDALALTGLIVANDGRMAGNARLRVKDVATVGEVAGSVAVTVPGGVPPGGTTTVVVSFPVGTAVRTLPLEPVLTTG